MYRSTRSRALLRGGGAAKRGIAAPKSRSLFVRSVGGRRVAYRFYFYEFEGAAYFRQLVTTKGGQVVTRADIASADFAISTVHVPDEAHSLPICTPQFLSDCVLEDTVKDPAEYLAEYPAAQSSQPGTQTSPMAYDDDEDDDEDGDEDDIIQDVRRLYDDGALDAEDRVVNSLLASQSRSISEYAAPEPGSPGASSTNSMDVSDSDYRTRRILNRTSRSFTDAPAKAASSAAAGGTPARAKARQSHGDRMAAGDPAPEKVGASSPELEMPFSQIPMGPNFTFIQSQVDGGAAPASARARRTRASKSTTGGYDNGVDNHSDNAGDSDDDDGNSNGNGNGRRLIELVHDLSDEEYPDPTAFLDPRDSGLNINYPVQDTSSSPDAGGPVTQDPEALTPDESSPVLISSGTASSQVTEPVPGEGPGSSDDDGDGNVNDTPDAPNVGIGKADEAGEDEDGDDGSGGTPAMDDGALAATGTKTRREAARAIEKRRQTLNVLGRPRGASTSRHISTCQRLLELYNLTKSDGGLGIQLDPALAPPARLVSGELHSRAYTATAASSPSTPTRRATFSGAMRVLGEGEPSVTDLDRLRYMCKVKGLMAGTELSVREALRTLYFFTGDWVSARRYILLGEESLGDDCMWSAEEDGVLLQGLDLDRMAALRQRKGSVEVYRRLQFLNTFHGPRAH
ncbi:hypothetical protein IWQ56_002728 [Coemansia nantahalensis]|nr:hypothetical protein IWQ56_002728 [Coemansia nantahalensis]